MKRFLFVSIVLSALLFAQSTDKNKSTFDIDKEIDKIMQAPPEKRRILMNKLKRKIFELNLEMQSSHLINLQHLLNRPIKHRGLR